MQKNITVTKALHILQANARPLESERIPLLEAHNRTLAHHLNSLVDHPNCDDSAMDGYACKLADSLSASEHTPVQLELVGEVPAGGVFRGSVGAGEAVRIFTGAPMPEGADAVVQVEVTREDEKAKRVTLFAPASAGFVRARGQDFMTGETCLRAGQVLDAAAIGLCAAMGHGTVPVVKRPRVGILATGDEIITPDANVTLAQGQVFNANSYAVAALVRQAGAEPVVLRHVEDDMHKLELAVRDAGGLDLLLTSGGVSMGKYDFVRDLLFEHGSVHFWKVMMKPGGPALFGDWHGLPVFGLPGNPVSSMMVFLVLVKAFIGRLLGQPDDVLPFHQQRTVIAGQRFKAAGPKMTFHRVALKSDASSGVVTAHSTGNQSSGVLRSMVLADALAVLPAHAVVDAGERVSIMPLTPYL